MALLCRCLHPGAPAPRAPDALGPALTAAIDNPREILRRYGLRPRKGLGQHFLVDASHLERIVAAAELSPTDEVLEIGPGLGVLTAALARAAGRVVAVEIDPGMRAVLADRLADWPNVEVVDADILQVDPADVMGFAGGGEGVEADGGGGGRAEIEPDQAGRVDGASSTASVPVGTRRRAGYKVVANLPYNITSAVLRHLLEARVAPERAVVMVQKEVADRILAGPGDMSILAVSVQFYAHPTRVSIVPAGAFYPAPKVDSTVLRLDVHAAPPFGVDDVARFFRVVRAGFGQKRKQLRNSLSAGLRLDAGAADAALRAAGIDPTRRAETLLLAEWAALAAFCETAAEGRTPAVGV